MRKRLFLFCIQLYLCTPLFTQINRYETYTPLEHHDYSFKVDFTLILSKLLEQAQIEEMKKSYEGKVHIYGGENGHHTYLGCLNCPFNDALSVWNADGNYGINKSSLDNNIWNEGGLFGNIGSDCSPWNPEGVKPPAIVDFNGKFYGYFTANEMRENRTEHVGWQKMTQDFFYVRDNYEKIAGSIK